MAIVKMKHLHLVAMDDDREELFELLQRMGCVEIDEPAVDPEDPVLSRLNRGDSQALSFVQAEQTGAEHALEVLKKRAPAKEGLLKPRPEISESELFDEQESEAARVGAEEINGVERRLNAMQTEESKLEAQKEALVPWLELDLPLETQSTAAVTIQLGTLPLNADFAQVEENARSAGELCQLTQISEGREYRYCLLVCHNSQAEAVLDTLKEQGWSRANLREWTGTAAENIARLDHEMEHIEWERKELEQELAAMGHLREPLRKLFDRTAAEVRREQSKTRLLDTECTFLLEGWLPAEKWPELEKALAPYPCAWDVTDPTPEQYPSVPVKLKNNRFTRPLNMVTEMYSLPAYGSLDPNPLMAPFFILFYGIMMADMGYGLVMMLASLIVLKKKKPKGTMQHFFGLLGLCGVSTFIMGGLTGGFFGDFIPQLLKLINPESTFTWFWQPLFTPLEDTMMILIGAMALGVIQIITGMAISFVKKLRDHQYMDALWEEVTWWVVFAGLPLAILGKTNIVLIVGGVMILVGSGWNAKGFGKVTAVFGSLYNHVTGYFGDVLSYSRLMALMLAGSVIAQVFNTLGAIPGNIVIFVLISLLGNTLNFALNLLGCYVHDLRLQCLEYFGKFYEDGGKAFRPLDLNTKYYDVVK